MEIDYNSFNDNEMEEIGGGEMDDGEMTEVEDDIEDSDFSDLDASDSDSEWKLSGEEDEDYDFEKEDKKCNKF